LLPRTYLVASAQKLFFRRNATRWANALRDAGADVIMTERASSHGDAFLRQEFPLMVAWPSDADLRMSRARALLRRTRRRQLTLSAR
jgi:hypothetical protein